ncbi:related to Exocyst complex component SEC5 [Saccharomycodes ludwigii]|uniref:Exocyst complex component SEC5 n=1 Tax=Saccharomycodes ludwigii TaxID=36035 RepID=A0A376B3Z3_9ASCO|nr:related to Exocyst complex component SEC5 [Saccharomycodes ludwigii]
MNSQKSDDKNAFKIDPTTLLNAYGLSSLDPTVSWDSNSNSKQYSFPAEVNKDNSYDILNELMSSQRGENITNINDIDPLNGNSLTNALTSVKDPQIYSINSVRFNSKLFLQNIHSQDTFADLTRDLDTLDVSLQKQSAQLKQLVQSQFFRYVRSKNNLDHIYENFSKNDDKKLDSLDVAVAETSREGTMFLKHLIDSNERLKNFRKTIEYVEANTSLINLPYVLKKHLNNGDYTNLMFDYKTTKENTKYTVTANNNIKDSSRMNSKENIGPVEQKVWGEIEAIMVQYRQYLWNKLMENKLKLETADDFLPLISTLLDLKSGQNPIMSWISSRLENIHEELIKTNQKLLFKLDTLRRNIKSKGSAAHLSFYLQFSNSADFQKRGLVDSPMIIEMWLFIIKYVLNIEQIVQRFINIWEHVRNFLDGTYQQSLLNDKKRENILAGSTGSIDFEFYLKLEKYQIHDVIKEGSKFIDKLVDILSSFFSTSEDNNDYFVPPSSNNLSCLRYLPKIIDPIIRFTTELGQLKISSECVEKLKRVDYTVLSQCISAINSTKLRDLANFDQLEDWKGYDSTITALKCTKIPLIVRNINLLTIKTVRDLVFAYEKLPVINGVSIVNYPPKTLLTGIELQQINSLETVLESILKNAAKNKDNPRNLKTLLTLNNILVLKNEVFPFILKKFDEAFDIQLSQKNLKVFPILEKMHSSILANYKSDLRYSLKSVIESSFNSINWTTYTTKTFKVSDYILETLMILVQVHKDCSTAAPHMCQEVLIDAQQFIAELLFKLFKPFEGRISADGLLKMVLDIQFFTKTLQNILDPQSDAVFKSCLQFCFQNDTNKVNQYLKEIEPVVNSNLSRTFIQFGSFKT